MPGAESTRARHSFDRTGLTAWLALIAVFAEFVADEGAGCGTPHGAQRAAQHGVSGNSPDHGAYAGADLGVGGIGGASTQGKGGGTKGGGKDKTGIHGGVTLKMGGQAGTGGAVRAATRAWAHYRALLAAAV